MGLCCATSSSDQDLNIDQPSVFGEQDECKKISEKDAQAWTYPYDFHAWKKCCDVPPGTRQSPIDLPGEIEKLPIAFKFELNYATVPINISATGLPSNLINTGYTIQLNIAEGQTLTLDSGAVYDLLQFHFHTKSEHTVDDHAYPLEMHLVHKLREGDELLVLGIFFDAQEMSANSDDFLSSFWDYLPGPGYVTPDKEVLVHLSSLASFITGSSFYNYPGSLTTPPLSECVTWIVAKEPLKCTNSHIDRFRKRSKHDANFRPPQQLGNRTIHRAEIVAN